MHDRHDISCISSHTSSPNVQNNGQGSSGSGVGWRLQHWHWPIQVSMTKLDENANSRTLELCAQWACYRGEISSIGLTRVEGLLHRQVVTYCKSKGSLMPNATGNDNRDITGWDSDTDNLIVVAVTEANNARCTFLA